MEFIKDHVGLSIVLILFGSCCLWCCLAHCIFLPFCTCLKRHHKLNQFALITDQNQPFKILSAHRGGSAERVENTIAAFKHAVDCEMNLLELDVHMTKDGEVVVQHDETLERMCGAQYAGHKMIDYDFADLPPIQKKIKMHMTAGDYNMRDDEDGKFTLLREVFEECPNAMVSIDMKERDDTLV